MRDARRERPKAAGRSGSSAEATGWRGLGRYCVWMREGNTYRIDLARAEKWEVGLETWELGPRGLSRQGAVACAESIRI